MPSPIATYDPTKMQVIIGANPASGFTDGTFISVSQDNDSYAKRTGADGEVARSKMANRGATMTLTLLSTSLTNAALSAYHLAGTIFPVTIKDGSNVVFGAQCWVQRPPNVDRGTDVSDSEWTIAIAEWTPSLGGNPAT